MKPAAAFLLVVGLGMLVTGIVFLARGDGDDDSPTAAAADRQQGRASTTLSSDGMSFGAEWQDGKGCTGAVRSSVSTEPFNEADEHCEGMNNAECTAHSDKCEWHADEVPAKCEDKAGGHGDGHDGHHAPGAESWLKHICHDDKCAEWAGVFEMPADQKHAVWTFQKVEGAYVAADMLLCWTSAATNDAAGLKGQEAHAEACWKQEPVYVQANTDAKLVAGRLYKLVFDQAQYQSVFLVEPVAGKPFQAYYMQHNPIAFEDTLHFLKDVSGEDIEPGATETDPDSDLVTIVKDNVDLGDRRLDGASMRGRRRLEYMDGTSNTLMIATESKAAKAQDHDQYVEVTGGINNFANGNIGDDEFIVRAAKAQDHDQHTAHPARPGCRDWCDAQRAGPHPDVACCRVDDARSACYAHAGAGTQDGTSDTLSLGDGEKRDGTSDTTGLGMDRTSNTIMLGGSKGVGSLGGSAPEGDGLVHSEGHSLGLAHEHDAAARPGALGGALYPDSCRHNPWAPACLPLCNNRAEHRCFTNSCCRPFTTCVATHNFHEVCVATNSFRLLDCLNCGCRYNSHRRHCCCPGNGGFGR